MLQDLLLISTAFCVALVIFLLSENLDLHKKQREMQKQIDTLKKEIEDKQKKKISSTAKNCTAYIGIKVSSRCKSDCSVKNKD